MKIIRLLVIALFSLVCFASTALSQTITRSIPFETLGQGEISSYRYDDPTFTGLDMLIKDKMTWEGLFRTWQPRPLPPIPEIDFRKEMLIVTMLGFQTSGGGPSTRVLRVSVDQPSCLLHVFIQDNETPGPLDVITNPFHIIRLPRMYTCSVAFEHQTSGGIPIPLDDEATQATP